MSSPNLLFLTHRIPYPPHKGEKIRTYHQVRFLAERGWRIHLFSLADDPADLDGVEVLRKFCAQVHVQCLRPWRDKILAAAALVRKRPMSVGYFYSEKLQRILDGALQQRLPDAVLCSCSPMAEYLYRSHSLTSMLKKRRPRKISFVMDFMDVDSEKWRQYAETTHSPLAWLYRLEHELLCRYEKKVASDFDHVAVVSRSEAEILKQNGLSAASIHVVSNGVDTDYFYPAHSSVSVPPGQYRMVFCGVMSYKPNVDAVLWFVREIFPLIRSSWPHAVFTIVGSNPTPAVRRLSALSGVEVTGWVEDVRPYIGRSHVVVVPLRLTRGVQNKVLEAMAMEKPVVATSAALDGLCVTPGSDVLCADDPPSFADAVARLANNPEERRLLGRNARRYVLERHCWSREIAKLDSLLRLTAGSWAQGG